MLETSIIQHQAPECCGGNEKKPFFPLSDEQFANLKTNQTIVSKCPKGNEVEITALDLDRETVYRYKCLNGCGLEDLLT